MLCSLPCPDVRPVVTAIFKNKSHICSLVLCSVRQTLMVNGGPIDELQANDVSDSLKLVRIEVCVCSLRHRGPKEKLVLCVVQQCTTDPTVYNRGSCVFLPPEAIHFDRLSSSSTKLLVYRSVWQFYYHAVYFRTSAYW